MVAVNARLSALKESMEKSVHLGLGCAPEGLRELPELGGFSSGGNRLHCSGFLSSELVSTVSSVHGQRSFLTQQTAECLLPIQKHARELCQGRTSCAGIPYENAGSRSLTDLSGPLGSSVCCQMG
ncbi:unnamed protein product [Rangifer tarandus platyrhynchus]|uniref:Uncharacterized protein n=2 Tax=Rangifer tarandus platyrhynchus TaxID=3082113 RepID=A0AC60A8P7_RANTA|nr:unnamed protein product [Rangifer tarandus platyrhynchus]